MWVHSGFVSQIVLVYGNLKDKCSPMNLRQANETLILVYTKKCNSKHLTNTGRYACYTTLNQTHLLLVSLALWTCCFMCEWYSLPLENILPMFIWSSWSLRIQLKVLEETIKHIYELHLITFIWLCLLCCQTKCIICSCWEH